VQSSQSPSPIKTVRRRSQDAGVTHSTGTLHWPQQRHPQHDAYGSPSSDALDLRRTPDVRSSLLLYRRCTGHVGVVISILRVGTCFQTTRTTRSLVSVRGW